MTFVEPDTVHAASSTQVALGHPQMSISSIADECFSLADGDRTRAAQIMRERVDGDDALRSALIEPLIDRAIWSAIRKSAHQFRRSFNVSAEQPRKNPSHGIAAMAQSNLEGLYAYQLSSGVSLGDATREELKREIEVNTQLRASYQIKEKFMRLTLDEMGLGPTNEIVRDRVSFERLEELRQEARKI